MAADLQGSNKGAFELDEDLMFQYQPALAANSRVGALADAPEQPITAAELTALVILGASAAFWSAFIRLPLRIPGSSLAYAVLPIAVGFAVVPRKLAGTTMSASAVLTASIMTATGFNSFGIGAMTSLLAIGPLLDLAVTRMRSGWRLYAGFVAAGVMANLLAFSLRGGSKLFGFDAPGLRPLDDWLSQAAVTYLLAGGLAGLLNAWAWFRWQE
jgi:hypothetical protein